MTRRATPEHPGSTQTGLPARPVAHAFRTRCRRHMDERMAEWLRHAPKRRRLMQARVKLKNARTKITRLEADLAVQRAKVREAEQIVLDLWPEVPAEMRGTFNDGLETLDEQMLEAAE